MKLLTNIKIAKKVKQRFQNLGINISFDCWRLWNGVRIKSFEMLRIDNNEKFISIKDLSISYLSFLYLLIGKKEISGFAYNIIIESKEIATYPIQIQELEYVLKLNNSTKDLNLSLKNLGVDICITTTKEQGKPEFFLKIKGISMNSYKSLFSNNILSNFLINYYDNTKIDFSAYYIHDSTRRFNCFNTLFHNIENINIRPNNIAISKESILESLSARNHISRNYISYDNISKLIKIAIISTEDPTFGLHRGISKIAMGMTIKENIQSRKLKIGGSSISQQLIKNALLSDERTIYRKLEEAILTLLMENYYHVDKRDIIEIYLNMIEFAPNVYGIEEASKFYFGKDSKSLNFVEVLTLTYIIPRPIYFYDALKNKTDILKRNLYLHILRFFSTLSSKGIEGINQESIYDLESLQFVQPFGLLDFIKPPFRKINKIIIHCTDTKCNENITIQQIRQWHMQRGFDDIGYHYVIDINGNIIVGRPLYLIGAHCIGQNNDSIGIAYIGGIDEMGNHCNTMTIEQENALISLCLSLKRRFHNMTIHGHNEFSNKLCPCFNVNDWLLVHNELSSIFHAT